MNGACVQATTPGGDQAMRHLTLTLLASILIALFLTTVLGRTAAAQSPKKALYVNSYHQGYAWSDSIQSEVEKTFRQADVQYQVVYMDTKNKKQPGDIAAAVQNVKSSIESFKPDVVIMSDDNAVRHVLVPSYKDSSLPFVFCGVNWDCADYGLPVSNVTGMLEISLIPQMLDTVRPLAKGNRIAILSNDNETDRMEGSYIQKKFNLQWAAERYVKTFAEWKVAYSELQDSADILFLYGTAGIADWDPAAAEAFIRENTTAITCSTQYYMKYMVLVGYMKSGEEQGYWASHTALDVLNGKKPADIPLAENKSGRITLNMKLAKKLGVVFPLQLIKQAELVGGFGDTDKTDSQISELRRELRKKGIH